MQKQTRLDYTNGSCFLAVDTLNNYEPVLSTKKTPVVFASLKTGKKYLSKRFKDAWTKKQFQMAKYKLELGEKITYIT